jgi:UDP:flavonoid glycosyltransferase YjiC (YdhE family)
MGAESWWLPEQKAVAGFVAEALGERAVATDTGASLAETLRRCDVLVTAGGDASLLTAVAVGVPVLVLPQLPEHAWRAHQFAATGAGVVIAPAELTADAVRTAVAELCEGTFHRAPLQYMRREMAARPTYLDVVARLPGLLGAVGSRREPSSTPA